MGRPVKFGERSAAVAVAVGARSLLELLNPCFEANFDEHFAGRWSICFAMCWLLRCMPSHRFSLRASAYHRKSLFLTKSVNAGLCLSYSSKALSAKTDSEEIRESAYCIYAV